MCWAKLQPGIFAKVLSQFLILVSVLVCLLDFVCVLGFVLFL